MLHRNQTSPVIRPCAVLLALAALTLSGCSQVYDDTKGWGNDVEAWFRQDVLAPIGAEMRGEPYPPRNEAPALAQDRAEPPQQPEAMAKAASDRAVKESMAKDSMAKDSLPKDTVVASTDSRLPAVTAAPAKQRAAEKPAQANAAPLGANVYPQTAGKAAGAAETKKSDDMKMAAKNATAANPAAAAMALHLSSNKSKESAMREWGQLKSAFPEQLGGLKLNIARTDLGKKGVFYRVLAGPFDDKPSAAQVCSQLKKKQQYCAVMPAPKKTG